MLLDPMQLPDNLSVSDFVPSPNGRYVAVVLKPNGNEFGVLRILEVATSGFRVSDGEQSGAYCVDPQWRQDSSGFYYSHVTVDPAKAKNWQGAIAIKYHRIGMAFACDATTIAPTGNVSQFLAAKLAADGRWLFRIISRDGGHDIAFRSADAWGQRWAARFSHNDLLDKFRGAVYADDKYISCGREVSIPTASSIVWTLHNRNAIVGKKLSRRNPIVIWSCIPIPVLFMQDRILS